MQKYRSFRQQPFWILTWAVIIAAVFAKLIQDGMFADAMLYTAVAKNQANGFGTFWFPYFSDSWVRMGWNSFHEQPPLVFGILAQFFRILGDSLYTERIYTTITTCISVWLTHKTWKIIPHKTETERSMSWLPVLIWITFPVVMWTHQNMMCENTMELFILGTVYFISSAFYKQKQIWLRLGLAGFCIYLAALSKGVPGLFPFAVVPVFWLVYQRFSFGKAVLYSLLVILVTIGLFALTLAFEAPREALTFYFEKRLMLRVNEAPVVGDRFRVMKELALHLLLVAGVMGIFMGIRKAMKRRLVPVQFRAILFFFIIGLCGSIPLMLTLVQRGFYMTPAMPFFAIALCLFISPTAAFLIDKMNTESRFFKRFRIISFLILIAALGFTISNLGKVSRDESKLKAVHQLDKLLDGRVMISLAPEIEEDWGLENYLMRYAEISVERKGELQDLYLSTNPRDSTGLSITSSAIDLGEYYLYAKNGKLTQ